MHLHIADINIELKFVAFVIFFCFENALYFYDGQFMETKIYSVNNSNNKYEEHVHGEKIIIKKEIFMFNGQKYKSLWYYEQ